MSSAHDWAMKLGIIGSSLIGRGSFDFGLFIGVSSPSDDDGQTV
jgi:hypothetical protein